ncbi:MAG TPA: ECF-type sigma factor [Gemmataceae bacterium]|nr:ECF-type sigma factor [Gemmataceae bacterium]
MSADFAARLARVRAGDSAAAADLVREYEPAVRVAVRAHLVDPSLRRHFDSTDVCQSVSGSFFVRMAAGQYDVADPAQLVALLVRMSRNKLASQARRFGRTKRDARRDVRDAAVLNGLAGAATGPAAAAAARELLAAVLDRLPNKDREIAQRRAVGQDWTTIGAEMGGSPDGRRKQLARAIDRLGLDGDDDE